MANGHMSCCPRRSNGWNGKKEKFFEESKQAMKHTPNPTFISSKWQDKIQESGLTMCANRLKNCKKLLLGL